MHGLVIPLLSSTETDTLGMITSPVYAQVFSAAQGKHALAPHWAQSMPPHHIPYHHDPWTGFTEPPAPSTGATSLSTVTLDQPGQALFVPSRGILSLRGTGTVLKFCFVDAANVNTFAAAVARDAHLAAVQANGDAVGGTTVSQLNHAVSGAAFDRTMLRSPGTLPWASFATWPRGSGTVSVASGAGSSASAGSDRRARGRRSQKDWQADVRWKWRIAGLTLPVLKPPIVVEVAPLVSTATVQVDPTLVVVVPLTLTTSVLRLTRDPVPALAPTVSPCPSHCHRTPPVPVTRTSVTVSPTLLLSQGEAVVTSVLHRVTPRLASH